MIRIDALPQGTRIIAIAAFVAQGLDEGVAIAKQVLLIY
jgi:hypothetical protein